MNNKKIKQKERFGIEIETNESTANLAVDQLQNWCKLFEYLSKTSEKPIYNFNKDNKRETAALKGNIPKHSFIKAGLFNLNNKSKRLHIYC